MKETQTTGCIKFKPTNLAIKSPKKEKIISIQFDIQRELYCISIIFPNLSV